MLTREEILSSFKQVDFPDKLIDKSISNKFKNIIFYKKSSNPSSEKDKNTQKLSESYVIPRHLLIQKNNQANQTHKNEFNRSSNFTPKEALIDIKIDNFKLIYDKYSVPTETNIIYFKNTYGGVNGPYNLDQIQNLYKSKKIDSNTDFRTIDIFTFKNSDLFSFQSIKLINDEKWTDSVVDNSLINYCDLYKNKKEEKKEEIIEKDEVKIEKEEEIIEKEKIVKEEKKIKESEGNWEVAGKKKNKVKSKEIKEKETKEKEAKEVKEEKKNVKKEDDEKDSLEQLEMKLKNEKKEDDLIEILKKKKMEKERLKQKEEEQKEEKEKEDVKEVKKEEPRSKKGKKKKKNQFAETEIDLGFLVK